MPTYNLSDTNRLRSDQYKDSSNLDVRAYLHDHFSTNKIGLQKWIFELLSEEKARNILDLGCGPGYLWIQNRDRIPEHWDLTFADISKGMLEKARKQISIDRNPPKFTVCNAQALPYPVSSFDLIIANHMLYHVPDIDNALAEIRRILRPGARLYTTTNGDDHLKEIFSILRNVGLDLFSWKTGDEIASPFSLENGAQLLRKGFSEVELHRYEDSLKVTEVEPLLNYILSLAGIRDAVTDDPARKERLHSFLKKEFNSKGFLHITKDTGLFIAS